MSDFPDVSSSIAAFGNMPELPGWPERRVIDVLIRESIERLFDICQQDPRAWLSDTDLQCLLFSVLRQYLPQHGISASSVHSQVQIVLPPAPQVKGTKQPRTLRADVALLVPHSLSPGNADATTEPAAVIQISRTFKVETNIELLTRLVQSQGTPLVYLVVIAYKELESDATRIRLLSQKHKVPVLVLNYWGKSEQVSRQPELL